MKKANLFLLLVVVLLSCKTNELEKPVEIKQKYYLLDFQKITDMIGNDYSNNDLLLKEYKIKETTSVGVRTGEYFLMDRDSVLMVLKTTENSSGKVSEINLKTSYLKYSNAEQLDIYIKHLKLANSVLTFSNGIYDNTYGSQSLITSVDDIIKKLQDNPSLRKDHTILCTFRRNSINIYAFYIANTYSVQIKL